MQSPATTRHATPSGFWQQIHDFPTSGAFEVTSVAREGNGFVAVGFGPMPGEGTYGRHQGIVWRSVDGRSWTPQVDPALQFVTPEDVVSLGDSVYLFGTIAMCHSLLSDECIEPPEAGWAVWRSIAGGVWERLPQLLEMQHGWVDGVIATDSGLIAFGWEGDEATAVVWSSLDGVTWTATADVAEMTQVTAMGVGPSGILAFGTRELEELGDFELISAGSTDGAVFVRTAAPTLPLTTIRSVASGPAGLVAVGEMEGADLALTTVALQSDDGQAWTQGTSGDDSFADGAASFVHAVPNGYVALGFAPLIDDFGVSTGVSWFSADGRSWRALVPFGQFTVLDASASAAAGIVAFTVSEEEPDDESVVSTVSAWFAPAEAIYGPL